MEKNMKKNMCTHTHTHTHTYTHTYLVPWHPRIMASGPITLWQIDGETVETVTDFIFWGSKITADGD